MKPYLSYKDSGIEWIGDIPEHWEVKKLKYWFDLITDKNGSQKLKIGLENIESGTGKFVKTNSQFSGVGVNFQPNDILFGKLRPYLAKVYLSDFYGSAVGDFFVMRPSREIVPSFAFHKILNHQFIELTNSSTYGAKMPRVSWEFISNLYVACPEIKEQTVIADFLDHKTAQIDQSIEKGKELICLLKEHRAALIHEAVTRGLDDSAPMKDSGLTGIGKIPAHWEVKKLKYVTTKIGSGITPRGGADNYLSRGVLFLRSQNIYFDGLRLNDVVYISDEVHNSMISSKVKKGDVLLNITGGSIGRCFYIDASVKEANVNQHVCIVRPDKKLIKTKYLYYFLRSFLGQNQIQMSQTGANREGLNFEQLKNFFLPYSKPEEQRQIVEYIETETARIDVEIGAAEREIRLLKEYRQALISEAVTGKIDVREVSLE